MSYTLDFNGYKKRYMTVILPDKKKTTLYITSPTNALRKKLLEYVSEVEKLDGLSEVELAKTPIVDELYALTAELMNRNKNNITVTQKQLLKLLDYEDVSVFLREYLRYLMGFETEKN